jgi:type IV secretory pathway VirB10-like protein
VDRHWGQLLAGAALSTLLGVGAELAAPENRTDGNRTDAENYLMLAALNLVECVACAGSMPPSGKT